MMRETNDEHQAEVGRAIAARRQELGLSQQALANLSGIPRHNLAAYETGRSDLRTWTLVQLCRHLQTTPNKLVWR